MYLKYLKIIMSKQKKVVVKVKEHKQRNMHQFNTQNVNGQEVLALFDSCSTLTLTNHGLIDKEKLGVSITTRLGCFFVTAILS